MLRWVIYPGSIGRVKSGGGIAYPMSRWIPSVNIGPDRTEDIQHASALARLGIERFAYGVTCVLLF